MKKIILGCIVTLGVVALGACSSQKQQRTTSTQISSKQVEQTSSSSSSVAQQTQQSQTTTYPEASYKNPPFDASFTGGNGYKIKSITKMTGSMDGKTIIAIELTFTNNGKTPNSPYMAFVTDWDVQQTDGTTTSSLNGANAQLGNVANQDAVKMGDTQVNPGATVDAIIGYTLADDNLDVGFITRVSSITSNPQGFAWANK